MSKYFKGKDHPQAPDGRFLITEEMRVAFKEKLQEKYKAIEGRNFNGSSINKAFVFDRANEILMCGTYKLVPRVLAMPNEYVITKETTKGIKENCHAIVEVTISSQFWYIEERSSFGGNDNPDPGDALKGATTDANTSLMVEVFGIAWDVFSGLNDPGNNAGPSGGESGNRYSGTYYVKFVGKTDAGATWIKETDPAFVALMAAKTKEEFQNLMKDASFKHASSGVLKGKLQAHYDQLES